MQFKRIIALIAVAFGAFFTAMMLLNLWSQNIQNAFDGSPIGKTVLSAGMLSVAFIALLIVLKLAENKK
ncbi:MAG: hypothetical protein PHW31_00850 [Candidatus Pacebacteria bacterium]|nr:hypothetical protein [Candidatus Paceibacterota bacterium]